MNSLRDMVRFVGIPAPARLFTATGTQILPQPTMRTISALAPVLTYQQRTSLRAMAAGLQSLPPVNLEAEPVNTVGETPFRPEVRVAPSGGVILETRAAIYQNGRLLSQWERNLGAAGGLAGFITLSDVGVYQFVVTRIGIPHTGITVLTKSFDVTVKVGRTSIPPDMPRVTRPTLNSVTSMGSGKLQVKGTGFLSSHPVHLRVVQDATLRSDTFQATSDSAGNLDTTLNIPPQLPGTVLAVSANDEWPDRSDLTGVLWSNTVQVTV